MLANVFIIIIGFTVCGFLTYSCVVLCLSGLPEVLLVAEVPGGGLAGYRSVGWTFEHGPLPELHGHRLHPQRREELLCQLEYPAHTKTNYYIFPPSYF